MNTIYYFKFGPSSCVAERRAIKKTSVKLYGQICPYLKPQNFKGEE